MRIPFVALAALTAATVSLAQEAPSVPLTFNVSASGTSTATFERGVDGLFVDAFTFTPPAPGVEVAVTLTPVSGGPINFTAALLNGEGFSFDPQVDGPNFSFRTVFDGSQPASLQVLGFAGDAQTLTAAAGTYAGSLSLASVPAIPEPQTWALVLAGLAGVATLARRRRRS